MISLLFFIVLIGIVIYSIWWDEKTLREAKYQLRRELRRLREIQEKILR